MKPNIRTSTPYNDPGMWNKLKEQFQDVFEHSTRHWHQREIEIFFELEALLHLQELLIPDVESRNARESWALISGYCIRGINDFPEDRQRCLLLRDRLRYIKTANAWRYWLSWYRKQDSELRLYDFPETVEGSGRFEQKIYGTLRVERLTTYERLYQVDIHQESVEAKTRQWANAGTYQIQVDGLWEMVEISEPMAAFANRSYPQHPLPERQSQLPIMVDLDILNETAAEIDLLEQARGITPLGHWQARFENLSLTLHADEQILEQQRQFTLDQVFHLVGALGVGKSTLIWVLAYYLAAKESRHVTVVLATVVETIRMASWLRRLGVEAAPALGKNRAEHAQKFALATTDSLQRVRLLQPEPTDEPALRWMALPCALSGGISKPIPIGQEPCSSLRDESGQFFKCPLIPVCPVHQLYRDLAESKVWIVNPMSFLYSSAPDEIGEGKLRLLEAIYRVSDVVIIDEADRVQVQWDRIFAPSYPFAGSDDAFLDNLHRELSNRSVGFRGRTNARNSSFSRLVDNDSQAHMLANKAFRLVTSVPQLVAWVKGLQITNESIYKLLISELVKAAPSHMDEDAKIELRHRLKESFAAYWRNPLRRESGFLADWLSRLLGSDATEKQLGKALHIQLIEAMGWDRVPSKKATKRRRQLLTRKLQLCIILTAILKRTQDISYLLSWMEGDIARFDRTQFEIREDISTLVPDPPLGILLGIRYREPATDGDGVGMFHFMRYRGIGRWLLLNFPNLYLEQRGQVGPHLLLTSATSWMPGAAQFHLAIPPAAVLLGRREVGTVDISFRPVQRGDKRLNVSGAGEHRESNLRQIVRALIEDGVLRHELDFWQRKGTKRALLLVVNSYEQTRWVAEEFQRFPEWINRVVRLLPDDTEQVDDGALRAREVETLDYHGADILIAPLITIQRGFNILDESDGALLGSVFFLIRPFPPPDDLSPQVLGMNAWALGQLDDRFRLLKDAFSAHGIAAMHKFRRAAYQEWSRRVNAMQHGVNHMPQEAYNEFVCDTLIAIWQTIGRLLRGGHDGRRDARVFFVDGAFSPPQGERRLLHDFYHGLATLMASNSAWEKYLALNLYGNLSAAFSNAFDDQEIY